MMRPTHRPSSIRAARAFTLIEMLIVIGLIVLLTGITVTVSTTVYERSQIRNTENLLKLLTTALNEWETTADRKTTWGTDGIPNPNSVYDIQSTFDAGTPADQLISLLIILRRSAASREILDGIDQAYLQSFDHDDNDSTPELLRIVDAWENPVYMIHPGRVASTFFGDNLTLSDEDTTIRVSSNHPNISSGHGWEDILGVCVNQQICFVSAGPDGLWGDLSAAGGSEVFEQAQDNIYSYPVTQP
jgi:type II secretory pathway pseudopilin PulG